MISRERLCEMLRERSPERNRDLFATADRVRACAVGDAVHLRALLEISSHCRRNCQYCGLRNSNTRLPRYRMGERAIVAAAAAAAARGRGTVVLQAGEDPALTAPRVARLVRRIKSAADVAVTLSLGEYSHDDYLEMRAAGADRYLLKHETIDPDIYAALHPGMSYEHRIRCLVWLKQAGFQVGGGMMVGIPGQTAETLADDIIFMRRLGLDMVGIGPFIPPPDTPLGSLQPGRVDLTLKAMAMARIAMPYTHIPATTALATLDPDGAARALRAGANVLMPNATPEPFRSGYDIYPNRSRLSDTGPCSVDTLLARLGRPVARGYGHSLRPLCFGAPFDFTVFQNVLDRV